MIMFLDVGDIAHSREKYAVQLDEESLAPEISRMDTNILIFRNSHQFVDNPKMNMGF